MLILFTKEEITVVRYLYTIKDRKTGEILFVGGEGASARFLGCDASYVRTLALRDKSTAIRSFYGDKEVTREWTDSSVECKLCGITIHGARPNRKYCPDCAQKIKRNHNSEGIPMQCLQEEGTYMHIQEKQRQMQERCHGCDYFGGENYMNATCNYLFIVGHSRGCLPGAECTQRKEKRK